MPLKCSTKASLSESLRFLVVVNNPAPETAQRSTSMNTNRILRKKEVLHLTGISSATLYRLISKGAFPLSKKLTGDSGRAVGWLESDINNWVNSRMQAGE